MRKTRLTRKASLPRTAPLPRSGIKRRGRKASAFARIYHSRARVAYVKSMPCCYCGTVPSDNAHTVTGGVGYKAGYATIIPLCRAHHRAYDEHRAPFSTEAARESAKQHAAIVESLWQMRSGGPEHISSVVARVMEKL